MEDNRLNKDFFDRGPAIVAKELLGNYLVRNIDGKKIIGLITETEAYGDEEDMASHARFGPTKRSQLMFGPPGHLYVYMIYGIFNLTNIVCGPDNTPGAVLLRSAQITKGESFATDFISKHKFTKTNNRLATGPGKLSEAFGISKELNGVDATKSEDLYFIQRDQDKVFDIISGERIGVDYAKHCKSFLWRFYIKNNPHVSKIEK